MTKPSEAALRAAKEIVKRQAGTDVLWLSTIIEAEYAPVVKGRDELLDLCCRVLSAFSAAANECDVQDLRSFRAELASLQRAKA